MDNEWLEVAYINFDKAIMHGRLQGGRTQHGLQIEIEVEQELTEDQRNAVSDLNQRHQSEMRRLLRSFWKEPNNS